MLELLENMEKVFKRQAVFVKYKHYRDSEVIIIITKGNSELLYFELFMATQLIK